MDRTSAPHKKIYDQGGSPQISVHMEPERKPCCTYIGLQTEIHFKPRASPQAELRPGRLPTSRITTREAPHKQNYIRLPTKVPRHISIVPPGAFYITVGYFWPREAQRERPTYISGLLRASLGLSGPLWASPGLSGTLWASLGLSGPLYIHTHIHREDKTIHNRQLEPQFSLGPEVARQQDHTIPDSWSPSVLRRPKFQDKKTRQYPTAGARPEIAR